MITTDKNQQRRDHRKVIAALLRYKKLWYLDFSKDDVDDVF